MGEFRIHFVRPLSTTAPLHVDPLSLQFVSFILHRVTFVDIKILSCMFQAGGHPWSRSLLQSCEEASKGPGLLLQLCGQELLLSSGLLQEVIAQHAGPGHGSGQLWAFTSITPMRSFDGPYSGPLSTPGTPMRGFSHHPYSGFFRTPMRGFVDPYSGSGCTPTRGWTTGPLRSFCGTPLFGVSSAPLRGPNQHLQT